MGEAIKAEAASKILSTKKKFLSTGKRKRSAKNQWMSQTTQVPHSEIDWLRSGLYIYSFSIFGVKSHAFYRLYLYALYLYSLAAFIVSFIFLACNCFIVTFNFIFILNWNREKF